MGIAYGKWSSFLANSPKKKIGTHAEILRRYINWAEVLKLKY
jgi:hypothetical protein